MKRHSRWLLAGCLLATGALVTGLSAAEPPAGDRPAGVAAASPNAAVIYWQAFAAMPTLEGDHKTKYEAAIKTVNEAANADLQPIVAQFHASLRELQRARSVAPCDWNLDYATGPELLLPHLQKARDLSRAALLRARLRFAAGEIDAAIADVLAVLKLAHDCGVSPLLISLLVDAAIENLATDVLAANLPRLQPAQLDQLAAALKPLPPTASLTDCLRLEGHWFGDWFENRISAEVANVNDPLAGAKVLAALSDTSVMDLIPQLKANAPTAARVRESMQSLTVADVQESLRQLRSDYDEIAKIAALNGADRASRWAAFEAKLTAEKQAFEAKLTAGKKLAADDWKRLLSYSALPAIAKVGVREQQLHVRRNLLALAVQVQRHGPEVLKSAPALGSGTVEHHKTETGFELRYREPSTDQGSVLQVGGAAHS